ncbi:MAG: CocE/NonD family hydrolase [bacterium]|nr:CocE/NonD family hydrolase [bacterium]
MSGILGILTETNVDVPMRDGVLLRANVFRPDGPGQYPGLLLRTPYGKPAGGYDRFVRSGYVVVTQDSRGRYASEGDYVPFTVENTGDAEDGYDSVEWLAQQPYCNGKVGTLGASYNAWMQWELARLRPPSLVAMCAYTIPLELTEVDYPGGFRPGRRIRWWMTTIAPDLRKRHGLRPPHTKEEANQIWNDIEHGRWLGFMPWLDVCKYLPPGLSEYAEDWLKHPNRRPWKFDQIHKEVEVPNLDFSGWYDHCNGTMAHLGLMQKNGRTKQARTGCKLILGPWNHGGLGSRKIGDIDFGPQAQLDLQLIMIRWFDHWLKNIDNSIDQDPPVRYFVMGSEKWKSADTWPPEHLQEQTFYFHSQGDADQLEGSGTLSQTAPEGDATDTYTYDPNDPMPTLWTPNLYTVPSNRRQTEYRTDVLYYRTEPLDEAVEIAGYPEVKLYASSSALDTDFFARLVDEHPDGGPAIELCYGLVRARHRHSLDSEDLLTPGEVTAFHIRLGATVCCFQKGHRIRLEITSSDFPNHDRNHNTGKNDLADTELIPARQEIYHSPKHPSHLILRTDPNP